MVEEPGRRAQLSHKQRLESNAFEYTLGPHCVWVHTALLQAESKSQPANTSESQLAISRPKGL
jgi:hypothetical protein